MNRWSPNAALANEAIEVDLWDRRELRVATKHLRSYTRARKKLGEVAPTGADALNDAFWSMTKANPQLVPASEIQPSHLVNRLVAREFMTLPSVRRMRDLTVGDPLQAATTCVALAPLLETVFDKLALEQALAQELQEQMLMLHSLRAELEQAQKSFDLSLGDDPSDDDVEAALTAAADLRRTKQEIDALEADLQARALDLEERLDDSSPEIRQDLRAAVTEALDEASALDAAARAWGLSPGALRRLPAAERVKLARKLNNQRMREIADLFGRIRNMSLYDPAVSEEAVHEEIVDLELGSDLGRVVPSELLLLGDPATELDFLARLGDGALLQYTVQGHDELGRGGIVMCVDGSGSMTGAAEMWSKAVMLVLLHEARAQRRTMHVIHFGSEGTTKHFGFVQPSDFTVERIFDAAGAFYGGGTHFETPMTEALRILSTEYTATGATRADVVFATDDECRVSPKFMTHYLDEMRRMGARTYGLEMRGCNPQPNGALMTMCEGRVASITDLQSGRDIRNLLRSVR